MEGFRTIMKRKYDGYKVYTHNFSYFDSMFIIDVLSRLGDVKPFMRDSKIMKLTFKFSIPNSKRKHTLYFMDSLLMLPNSLDKLSKSFNIDNKKSIFPHLLLEDPNISLNYRGKCPDYYYFPKADTGEFKYLDYLIYASKFFNKEWVLKDELIKYCENDTIALYQILKKFQEIIYKKFWVDFTKYPTIPSLTFAIFRSNFMKKNIIPIIKSKLHKIIKLSYFGGLTDVFKPFGSNIRSFDINSLYPHSMKTFPMPTGTPIYVQGNLENIKKYIGGTNLSDKERLYSYLDKIPFGFYFVDIKAPDNLDKPFLPTKIATRNGVRTVSPIGKWSGWYFSEEINNAIKYGYSFDFKEGYLFKKSFFIFRIYWHTI